MKFWRKKKNTEDLQLQIKRAGDDAVAKLIAETLRDRYVQLPGAPNDGACVDVRQRKDEKVSPFSGSPLDTQVTSIDVGDSDVTFTMRVPDNSLYRVNLMSNVGKFFGELGFRQYVPRPEENVPLGETEYAHKGGTIFTPEAVQQQIGVFKMAVDKNSLLEKLGIKAQAMLAEQNAKSEKSKELGVVTL